MDHHDWSDWSEDGHGTGDAEAADLSGHDLGPDDLGSGHDDLTGLDDHEAHDISGYGDETGDSGPGPTPAPDLLHDFDTAEVHEPGLTHTDEATPDDLHTDPGHVDAADDHGDPARPDDGHLTDAAHDDGTAGDEDHSFNAGDQDTDHIVGTDPDLHPGYEPDWSDPAGHFPPALDLATPPEPGDGYPWSDPDALGTGTDPHTAGYDLQPQDAAGHEDLLAYAGLEAPPAGVDPWSMLVGSDDPATSALARWWGPNG